MPINKVFPTVQHERPLRRVTAIRGYLTLAMLLTLSPAAIAKASEDWAGLASKGEAAAIAGDYENAIRDLRSAVVAASESKAKQSETLIVIDKLAGAYADTGQFAEADRQWRRALPIAEMVYGRYSLPYGSIIASLAGLPVEEDNVDANIVVLNRVVTENGKVPFSRNTALIRLALGQLLVRQKRYSEAEALLGSTEAGFQVSELADLQLTAKLQGTLGVLCERQGLFAEAAERTRRGLSLLESVLGKQHPLLVMPLNNLSIELASTRNYGASLEAVRRENAICTDRPKANLFDCAIALENGSILLRRMGYKQDAKRMAKQAQEALHSFSLQNGIGMTIAVIGQRP